MRLSIIFKRFGLHNKLAFFSLSLIVLQTAGLGAVSIYYLQQNLDNQIGKKALAVAQSISRSHVVIQGLREKRSDKIQFFVEDIRHSIDARFIVIGDTEGIRYSHPEPHKIGKKMVGGDNLKALQRGESYISRAVGSLGLSLRGKSPIYYDGKIIGLVSVGYLEKDINQIIGKFKKTFLLIFSIILFCGVLLTLYIAKRYRDEIFGLEPEEIARTYTERKAVLESILEAIVVINEHGIVTSVNPVASEILGGIKSSEMIGQSLSELLPGYQFLFADNSQQSWRDIEVEANQQTLIMTKTPLIITGKNRGVVLTFRLKDDIVVLSQKLSQVEQFSKMLREQTHEYSNKLNTISGLLEIGSIDKALEIIVRESSGYQEIIEFLMRTVPDPILAGLILGKYHAAKERNIDFVIDKEGSLTKVNDSVSRQKLVTILGNLIDNAFEASLNNMPVLPRVQLSMTDIGADLIFEIEDSGNGIDDEVLQNIFSIGKTTKSDMGHGIGMYLVKNCLDQLGGTLSISSAKNGGTIMTVYIPNKPNQGERSSLESDSIANKLSPKESTGQK